MCHANIASFYPEPTEHASLMLVAAWVEAKGGR
jgi:hypothetical protein